jgi:DNA-binding LacI/PurR family transcriptional regulator
VAHLLGRGARKVAAIAGPQDMGVGMARLAFKAALKAAKIPAKSPPSYGDFSEASGASAV